MTIKFKKLNEDAIIPSYQTKGAAGFDLHASEKFTILNNGGTFVVPTGLSVELPEDYELQIRPRSGLAAKHEITVLNTPGTIDSDYRGEIKILLKNFGPYTKTFDKGERIAQGVINKIEKPIILEVTELTETERGEAGFGSTGSKA
jgi:dUTP pyrophosphatase